MGPKPIQDIAFRERPVANPARSSTEPPAEPEIVHDIPVRQPIQNMSYGEGPMPPGGDQGPSFIASDYGPKDKKLGISLPLTSQKERDKTKPTPKDKKSKPVLAAAVLLVSIVFLATGTYLKYFNGS